MTKLLALDISSKSTGWAIFTDGKLAEYGLIKVDPKNGWAFRLSAFAMQLRSILEEHQPDHVVIEDIYRGPSALTFKVLAFFHGVAYQLISDTLYLEPELIGVLTARSALAKEAGVSVCRTKEHAFFIMNSTLKLDFDFDKDNDIADACALAYGYFSKQGMTPHKKLKFNKTKYNALSKAKKKRTKKNGSIQSIRSKKRSK